MNAFPKFKMFKMPRLVKKTGLKQSMSALSAMFKVSSKLVSELQGISKPQAKPTKQNTDKETQQFKYHNFENAAGKRRYKLFTPALYKGQAMPLVIMMHGCTQSPEDFAAGTQMNEIAEKKGFFVAYPEQTKTANITKCWNWFSAKDQKRDKGEASIIAGITRQIVKSHKIDKHRIYIAGLSAGGAFAAIMGEAYPDLYAAIGVHSGLASGSANSLVNAMSAMRHGSPDIDQSSANKSKNFVPVIVFHGDTDNTVHSINGDQIIAQAKRGAVFKAFSKEDVTDRGLRYTVNAEKDRSGKTMIEHWVLHGAGHAWSGGSNTGSYTEPRGPNASKEMVRFFLQHENV